MVGNSMSHEEFVKLSHFDRIRRGYIDKIPLNFMLIGMTLVLNVFAISNLRAALICGIVMFSVGAYLKEKFIEKDNMELKQSAKSIEDEFQKRETKKQKGRKR